MEAASPEQFYHIENGTTWRFRKSGYPTQPIAATVTARPSVRSTPDSFANTCSSFGT